MQNRLVAVHVFDKALDPAGECEFFFLAGALIGHGDFHAMIQEGQFAQAFRQNFIMKFDVAEDFLAGQEMHLGAATLAFAGVLERGYGLAHTEFHLVHLAVATDGQAQPFRQRVDHGYTDAVQAAGNLVRVAVELATGMKFGHHHFGGGAFFLVFRMNIGRNAAAVVGHADRIVRMDDDGDFVAVTRQRFVDRVIDHLEYHVVQTGTVAGVADIHAGTFAYGLKSLEDLDTVAVVFVSGARFFVAHCFSFPCCFVGCLDPHRHHDITEIVAAR